MLNYQLSQKLKQLGVGDGPNNEIIYIELPNMLLPLGTLNLIYAMLHSSK